MIKDLGIHCSEKRVYYIKRKRDSREFKQLEKNIANMNAVFSEMCEVFLIEDDKLMKVRRSRIDQTRIERHDDEISTKEKPGNRALLQGALYISNFVIVPTNRLRVYDLSEQKKQEVGLSVKVYTRISKRSYKCIELNLLNETLANSKWINPDYLDYDFYLYKGSLYNYLLRSLQLATRLLKKEDEKVIFSDEVGWVDYFYGRDTSGIIRYSKNNTFYTWVELEGSTMADRNMFEAIFFLESIRELINKSKFLEWGDKSDLSEGFIGWENNDTWAINYKLLNSHIKDVLESSGHNFKVDSNLYKFLFRQGILSIDGDIDGAFRPNKKFGNGNKRAFVLNKRRFHNFLSDHQQTIE